MPRAAKVCPAAGCPHLAPCPVPEHRKIPWAGSNRRSELPPDWEKRRQAVIARADHICEECRDAIGTEVHHAGDKHDHRIESLKLLCGNCHGRITQEQSKQARRT